MKKMFSDNPAVWVEKVGIRGKMAEKELDRLSVYERSIMKGPFLSPEDFKKQLSLEKRRVERCPRDLSVAVFKLQDPPASGRRQLLNFLGKLEKRTRETDIKGWIDKNTIGLILPDTNTAGMKKCIESLDCSHSACIASVMLCSYPDQILEAFGHKEKKEPQIYPFDVELSGKGKLLQRIAKRALDIMGSSVGLIVFSPFMMVIAALIKITSKGPVIFKQARLGEGGRSFTFLKFRSMRWNNDDRIHREYVAKLINGELEEINQGHPDQPLYKMKNDIRITFIGKIIRSLSLDELPQLINVLKGEMSLVGPRPPLPYEVDKYQPWHLRRILEVKPGITGLWQVRGRSRTSFEDMVRMDIRYINEQSILLDIKILFKTMGALILRKGAA
jgi:lipopolysaccharide/colanic/teichoic acid biosynthesis glycosyltransferase